jgi:hypothetical protein
MDFEREGEEGELEIEINETHEAMEEEVWGLLRLNFEWLHTFNFMIFSDFIVKKYLCKLFMQIMYANYLLANEQVADAIYEQ